MTGGSFCIDQFLKSSSASPDQNFYAGINVKVLKTGLNNSFFKDSYFLSTHLSLFGRRFKLLIYTFQIENAMKLMYIFVFPSRKR